MYHFLESNIENLNTKIILTQISSKLSINRRLIRYLGVIGSVSSAGELFVEGFISGAKNETPVR